MRRVEFKRRSNTVQSSDRWGSQWVHRLDGQTDPWQDAGIYLLQWTPALENSSRGQTRAAYSLLNELHWTLMFNNIVGGADHSMDSLNFKRKLAPLTVGLPILLNGRLRRNVDCAVQCLTQWSDGPIQCSIQWQCTGLFANSIKKC